MVTLITCNGYRTIAVLPVGVDTDLPQLCRDYEALLNDGYAVLASSDGRFVADADGLWPDQKTAICAAG